MKVRTEGNSQLNVKYCLTFINQSGRGKKQVKNIFDLCIILPYGKQTREEREKLPIEGSDPP
jgi:hypothetical protein